MIDVPLESLVVAFRYARAVSMLERLYTALGFCGMHEKLPYSRITEQLAYDKQSIRLHEVGARSGIWAGFLRPTTAALHFCVTQGQN